jgi:hypothetical protein
MTTRTGLCLLVTVAGLLAGEGVAQAATFLTPSHNISCTTPSLGGHGGISCTVFSEANRKGQKIWEMQAQGRAFTHHLASNAASEGRTLDYGETYSGYGVHCVSRMSGLRCHNKDGHGFRLSRQRQKLF